MRYVTYHIILRLANYYIMYSADIEASYVECLKLDPLTLDDNRYYYIVAQLCYHYTCIYLH